MTRHSYPSDGAALVPSVATMPFVQTCVVDVGTRFS